MDPGTLISVESKNDKVVEKYSDGLTTEIDQNGSVEEFKPADNYTMKNSCNLETMPPELRDDDISTLINLAFMHGHQDWNDSRVQSRLRQFSSFYLKIHEPEKAEPLAKMYLHCQHVLHTSGEPVAFAQANLGEAKAALGKSEEAIPLLRAAAAYYRDAPDHLRYCNILSDLGCALSRSGHPKEGKAYLGDARKTAAQFGIEVEVEKNIKMMDMPVSQSSRRPGRDSFLDSLTDTDSRIKSLWDRYNLAAKESPYGIPSANALDELTDVALLDRNWSLLAASATARCEIYEHTPDPYFGRQVGCLVPSHVRLDSYSRAALAYIHLDQLDEAKKWLQRAVENMHQLTCLEYITIALLELDCDDRALATKYAELSEPLFTKQFLAVYPAKAERVWNCLGYKDRAAQVGSKARELYEASTARTKQNSP